MKTRWMTVLALAITFGMLVWLSSPSPVNASLIASSSGMDTDMDTEPDSEETDLYDTEPPLEEETMEAEEMPEPDAMEEEYETDEWEEEDPMEEEEDPSNQTD